MANQINATFSRGLTDEFGKKFDEEIENMPLLTSDGKARRRRAASMSDSEIMTILIMFHFGTFDNFKHYYLHFIQIGRASCRERV